MKKIYIFIMIIALIALSACSCKQKSNSINVSKKNENNIEDITTLSEEDMLDELIKEYESEWANNQGETKDYCENNEKFIYDVIKKIEYGDFVDILMVSEEYGHKEELLMTDYVITSTGDYSARCKVTQNDKIREFTEYIKSELKYSPEGLEYYEIVENVHDENGIKSSEMYLDVISEIYELLPIVEFAYETKEEVIFLEEIYENQQCYKVSFKSPSWILGNLFKDLNFNTTTDCIFYINKDSGSLIKAIFDVTPYLPEKYTGYVKDEDGANQEIEIENKLTLKRTEITF